MNVNGITNAVSSFNSDNSTKLKKNANNVTQEASKASMDEVAVI